MKKSASSQGDRADVASQLRSYFAELPTDARRILRKMREDIRAAAPGATESFSYGIPGFKLDGKVLIYYAGWKQHVSLYPMTAGIQQKYARQLEGYEMSKGTIRFPLTKPPSSALVKRLVKGRLDEVRAKSRA